MLAVLAFNLILTPARLRLYFLLLLIFFTANGLCLGLKSHSFKQTGLRAADLATSHSAVLLPLSTFGLPSGLMGLSRQGHDSMRKWIMLTATLQGALHVGSLATSGFVLHWDNLSISGTVVSLKPRHLDHILSAIVLRHLGINISHLSATDPTLDLPSNCILRSAIDSSQFSSNTLARPTGIEVRYNSYRCL